MFIYTGNTRWRYIHSVAWDKGPRLQGPGKREISPTQAPLLRSFFTHTLAWLVSQETDPGWIYRHAQKSLIRKRSQETHRLWLADYRGTDTDGTMIQRRITQVHLQSAGISRRCDGEHRCVGQGREPVMSTAPAEERAQRKTQAKHVAKHRVSQRGTEIMTGLDFVIIFFLPPTNIMVTNKWKF